MLNGLKLYKFIILYLCQSEVHPVDSAGFSAHSQGPYEVVGRAVFFPGGCQRQSAPKLIRIVGGIRFHAKVKGRSLFLCWLWLRIIFNFWGLLGSWPLVSKASNDGLSSSSASGFLDLHFCPTSPVFSSAILSLNLLLFRAHVITLAHLDNSG